MLFATAGATSDRAGRVMNLCHRAWSSAARHEAACARGSVR